MKDRPLLWEQLRSQLTRLAAIVLLAALLVLVSLLDSKLTEALKLESVVLETDGQGYVWPNSSVTVTFNKRLPEEWLKERLHASPPVAIDVSVEHVGRWLRKTRLTITPAKAEGFAPDSAYSFRLGRPDLGFRFSTITTPRVVTMAPSGSAVKTTAPLVLVFDRPMNERATTRITSTPEVALDLAWHDDRTLVVEHPRLRNATVYEFVLPAGMEDARGRPLQNEIHLSFKTVDPPTIAEFAPVGWQFGLLDAVKVTFSADVDRKTVEAGFSVEPPAEGSFEWPDAKTLVWRPNSLQPGQSYRIEIGGWSRDGDPIVAADWRFRTLAPPTRMAPGGGGKLTLTFDDYPPSLAQAEALLEILARYQARAILFPTGKWAAAHPEFVARAKAEGHLICNHTYGHARLTTLSEEAMRFQILNGAGADECDLLRPPYAASNDFVEAVAASLGYQLYLWNVDSRDWEGLSARQITDAVLENAHPGAVVLFHLHGAHTLEALPAIIEAAQGAGFVVSY